MDKRYCVRCDKMMDPEAIYCPKHGSFLDNVIYEGKDETEIVMYVGDRREFRHLYCGGSVKVFDYKGTKGFFCSDCGLRIITSKKKEGDS